MIQTGGLFGSPVGQFTLRATPEGGSMSEFRFRSPITLGTEKKNWVLLAALNGRTDQDILLICEDVFKVAVQHEDDEAAVAALEFVTAAIRQIWNTEAVRNGKSADEIRALRHDRSISAKEIAEKLMTLALQLPDHVHRPVSAGGGRQVPKKFAGFPKTRGVIADAVGYQLLLTEDDVEAARLLTFLVTVPQDFNINAEIAKISAEAAKPHLMKLPLERVGKLYLSLGAFSAKDIKEALNSWPYQAHDISAILWETWSQKRGPAGRREDIYRALEAGITTEKNILFDREG